MAIGDYKVVDDFLVGPSALSDTQSSKQFPLGIPVKAVHTNGSFAEFVYAQGSNVASAGQFVHLFNGSAVLLASANSASYAPIGVAAGALSATNAYGWVQVRGYVDYAKGTNSAVAANVAMYLGATAGQLASNVGIGSKVQGVFVPTSYTSSQSQSFTVLLNYPTVQGVTASQ